MEFFEAYCIFGAGFIRTMEFDDFPFSWECHPAPSDSYFSEGLTYPTMSTTKEIYDLAWLLGLVEGMMNHSTTNVP